jgi:hypothetical protein
LIPLTQLTRPTVTQRLTNDWEMLKVIEVVRVAAAGEAEKVARAIKIAMHITSRLDSYLHSLSSAV